MPTDRGAVRSVKTFPPSGEQYTVWSTHQTMIALKSDNASADSKAKSAVVNLEGKQGNYTPVKPAAASQAKKLSAITAPINKHKQSLASVHSKKNKKWSK